MWLPIKPLTLATFILTTTNASPSHEPHETIRSPDIDFTGGSKLGGGEGRFSVQLDCNPPSDKKSNETCRQPNLISMAKTSGPSDRPYSHPPSPDLKPTRDP